MATLSFVEVSNFDKVGWTPRTDAPISIKILEKMKQGELKKHILEVGNEPIYVHRVINNFIKAVNLVPFFKKATGEVTVSDDFKRLYVHDKFRHVVTAMLNSSLFYWYWRIHGDGFHCSYKDIGEISS